VALKDDPGQQANPSKNADEERFHVIPASQLISFNRQQTHLTPFKYLLTDS